MKISAIFLVVLSLVLAHSPAPAAGGGDTAADASARCMECHEEMAADHDASIHRDVPCLACHVQAVEEDHGQMAGVDCRQCHSPHDEKRLHDAHTRVACMACHLNGGIPAVDPGSDTIGFSGRFLPGTALPVHQSIQALTEASCRNCHVHGNGLGASSTVLPPKSILCMPCHVSTFSAGDTTTLVSLFIFLAGMAGLVSVWFSGSLDGQAHGAGAEATGKIRLSPGAFLGILLEAFLLKRLFQRSKTRWAVHALIFFPLLFRLAFGLKTLALSLVFPDWAITQALMDKNNAGHALFFDVTGLMILAGSIAAFARRDTHSGGEIASLPQPGWGMPFLIVLMVVNGFVLEGMRIAMTGWPGGSEWAFAGYGASLLFKGMTGLTEAYAYVWYAHAILAGAFVALIPFTRMAHIVTAPMVLILNARSREGDAPGN